MAGNQQKVANVQFAGRHADRNTWKPTLIKLSPRMDTRRRSVAIRKLTDVWQTS